MKSSFRRSLGHLLLFLISLSRAYFSSDSGTQLKAYSRQWMQMSSFCLMLQRLCLEEMSRFSLFLKNFSSGCKPPIDFRYSCFSFRPSRVSLSCSKVCSGPPGCSLNFFSQIFCWCSQQVYSVRPQVPLGLMTLFSRGLPLCFLGSSVTFCSSFSLSCPFTSLLRLYPSDQKTEWAGPSVLLHE